MFRKLFAWVARYERHLSAAAMVAGFIIDNIFFSRVDLPQTEALFIGYIIAAAFAIALLHYIESRAGKGKPRPRWRSVLPLVTQFALGGMWSGFLIFYTRSADLSTSWPFLLVLLAIFLGNEIFSKYHDKLVFTTLLFFFGLYSYAIFAVPVFTGSIGAPTFLLSGAIAAGIFILFLILLRVLGNSRFLERRWAIRGGALAILVVINLFYFTNILPPLPLALKSAGVYHSIVANPLGGYIGESETSSSWQLPWAPVLEHVPPGGSLYVYSAVFAPVKLATTIVHHWEYYDTANKKWVTASRVSFPITGGRDGGYRGYSAKTDFVPGAWRVSIETPDGKIIGRTSFTVVDASTTPALSSVSL